MFDGPGNPANADMQAQVQSAMCKCKHLYTGKYLVNRQLCCWSHATQFAKTPCRRRYRCHVSIPHSSTGRVAAMLVGIKTAPNLQSNVTSTPEGERSHHMATFWQAGS